MKSPVGPSLWSLFVLHLGIPVFMYIFFYIVFTIENKLFKFNTILNFSYEFSFQTVKDQKFKMVYKVLDCNTKEFCFSERWERCNFVYLFFITVVVFCGEQVSKHQASLNRLVGLDASTVSSKNWTWMSTLPFCPRLPGDWDQKWRTCLQGDTEENVSVWRNKESVLNWRSSTER